MMTDDPKPTAAQALAALRAKSQQQRPSAAEALAALRSGASPDFSDVSGGSSTTTAPETAAPSSLRDRIRRAAGIAFRAANPGAGLAMDAAGHGLTAAKDIASDPAGAVPTALHGATFGFSDEALAGMRTLGNDQDYATNVAAERQRLADYQREHPDAARAMEFGGSLVTGNALLKGANALYGTIRGGRALAEGGRILQGAKAGLVAGGVAGAGNADDKESRTSGAINGGLTGAAFGAVLGRIFGQEEPKDRVKETLTRGLKRDMTSANQVMADRAGMPKLTGDQETIVELSGPAMRRIARGTEAMPGEGSTRLQRFAKARGEAQPVDATTDLGKIMGRPSEDTYQLVDDLIAARKAGAQPLYDRAYQSAPIQVTPEVTAALNSPSGKLALARAQSIMGDEIGAGIVPSGGVSLVPSQGQTLDIRAVDYIKKGLDDIIDGRVGAEGGLGPNSLRAATALKNKLLDLTDAQMAARGDVDANGVPFYRLARQQWSNETKAIQSIELGRQAVGKHPGEIRQMRRNLGSAVEQEGFEIGWMQGAADDLAKSTPSGQLAPRLNRSHFNRDGIAAALGDDPVKVGQVEQMLARRGAIAETNRAFGGSRTTPTAEDVADLTGGSRIGNAITQAGTRGPWAATREAVARAVNRRMAGIDEKNAGRLAGELTKTGPELDALLAELAKYVSQRQGTLSNGLRTGIASGANILQR